MISKKAYEPVYAYKTIFAKVSAVTGVGVYQKRVFPVNSKSNRLYYRTKNQGGQETFPIRGLSASG